MDPAILERRLKRAQAEVEGLERMIETKARDLFLSRESLRESTQFLENVLRTMSSALVVLDAEGTVQQANAAAKGMLGLTDEQVVGRKLGEFAELPSRDSETPFLVDHDEIEVRLADGSLAPTLFSSSVMRNSDETVGGYVCVWVDLREKKQLEIELRHAQKLESLGQMAAGVAHEINTPIQFVGDSLRFLQEAFADMQEVLGGYRAMREALAEHPEHAKLVQRVEDLEEEADLEFVEEEAPGAFERAANGLERVATIVKALKSHSHPGSDEVTPVQLNETIETTLTLAHNEYKYVAELTTDLGLIPEVPCNEGDMGQVFLNLVVNAAHAIADKVEGTDERGTIHIASFVDGDDAVFEVRDSGSGIPDEVVGRIFDPFFTTKDVGKGTGQGLSIVRRIVVEKHSGKVDVETEVGQGTTFRLRLPLSRRSQAA